MDRRILKTKKAIFDAFSNLLQKKTYEKITIQEIIDEANVGRSTFYMHFESKEDLLNQMCSDLFEHITNTLKTEKSHNFANSKNDSNSMITHILYHLKDDFKELIPLLSCESSALFYNYFEEYFKDFISNYLISNSTKVPKNVPTDFLISHISGSFINLIKWWIINSLKQSPEELTSYFFAVINIE